MHTSDIYKLVVPALIALFSWLIKDFLFGLNTKRNEQLQKEWKFRLKEIWSPLFYWSGIVMFNEKKKGWDKHGIKELEAILAKSAHLLPLKHYYILIKFLEMETGQTANRFQIDDIIKTRDYIYKQIELLNYLLYRRSRIDALDVTDILSPYKTMLRLLSFGAFHLIIWVFILLIVALLYSLYMNDRYWIMLIIVACFAIIMAVDISKRMELHKEIKKRLRDS